MKLKFIIALLILTIPTKVYAYYPEEYTPYDLENYLQTFSYKWIRANNCYAQVPTEFIENGGGTCKDFAYFSARMLENMGYEPFIFIYRHQSGYLHAITVFEWEGRLWAYDVYNLIGPFDTVHDISLSNQIKIPVRRRMCVDIG